MLCYANPGRWNGGGGMALLPPLPPPPPLFRQENSIETGNHRVFGVLNAKRSRLRRVKITENIFPYREMLEGVVYLARALFVQSKPGNVGQE